MYGKGDYGYMYKLKKRLKKRFKNEKGQGMVEYGLILATVSIVAILGLSTLGGNINDRLEGIADSMSGISEPGKYSDEEIQDLIKDGYIPIATAEDLNSVRSTENRIYAAGTDWEGPYTGGLNKKYVQVLNIDLSGYSGEGWTPIGSYTTHMNKSPFIGTYDGGNYVIIDLEVKGDGKNYQGLFGYTEGATISNVGLTNNKVTGNGSVGGLVGYAQSSKISNSYTTGPVKAYWYVGGLVGRAGGSTTISNSYATGSVEGVGYIAPRNGEGGSYVGGLVGYTEYSTIEDSYATGLVIGASNRVGGLIGSAYSNTAISNSYATGPVTGLGNVGGLAGYAISSTIESSYATGSVTGSGRMGGLVGYVRVGTISNSYATGLVKSQYYGGLVGWADSIESISSYWDKDTTGKSMSVGGIGKSTADMMKQTTYEGWEFDTIWKIQDGASYPTLINNPEKH